MGEAGRNGGLKSAAAAPRLGRHTGRNADVELMCETRRLCHTGKERNTKDLCVCVCSIISREGERGRERERREKKVFAIAKAGEKSVQDVTFPYLANK